MPEVGTCCCLSCPRHLPACPPVHSRTDQNLLLQMNCLKLTSSWSRVGVGIVPVPKKAKEKGELSPIVGIWLQATLPPLLLVLPFWSFSLNPTPVPPASTFSSYPDPFFLPST